MHTKQKYISGAILIFLIRKLLKSLYDYLKMHILILAVGVTMTFISNSTNSLKTKLQSQQKLKLTT